MGAMDARHMSHDTASCSFRCQPILRKRLPTCRKVHRGSHSCRTRQENLQVCAGIENIWGVLAFSALPFATVQALADSNLGKKLRNDLEEKKPQYKAQEREKQAAMAKARQKSHDPERPMVGSV